ncbi:hypothetical protein LQW54_006591 [Pestalotiopsis sp. IQ-011]
MYSHAWSGLSEYRPSQRKKWTKKNRLIFVTGFPTGSHRADIEQFLAAKQVAPCILLWPSEVETGNLNYRCHMLFQQAADSAAATAALNGAEFHGRDLRTEIPQDEDWIYRPDDPNAYERAVYRDLEEWSSTVEEEFPSAHFILGQPSYMVEGLRLMGCQHPSPSAVNDDCRGAYVTEVKRDWVNDTVESETVLLENIGKRQSEGWEVWYHPDRPCDKDRNGADPRQVAKIEDILNQDKPHLDTESSSTTGTPRQEATTTLYGLQGRLQSAGRQIKKEMVRKKNWNKGNHPVVLSCPEDPTVDVVLPPSNASDNRAAEEEGGQSGNLISLW